ncbi:ABC transporter permease [Amycolatopsis sp. K13G38]|uniref:ABC transporter permease n=1 Tax=Amycolatopsis acididurans TaxID=2724524 RepID=A0ABX1J341_9PSEU|nr:ABC transporter permease [Amycolatopsis acididurans]NKQ54225.1 ABC transporter permease [Amycolatopsis acididurans]
MVTSQRHEAARQSSWLDSDGPYDGAMSKAVGFVPGFLRNAVAEAGGMAEMLIRVLWSAIRHPRGYWSDVVAEMHFTIRRSWISITAALCGFLLALSVPSSQFLQLAGAGELYGPMLLVQSTRTFTVWVAALLVAGVIGAAATAELGSRKVREELDAMKVMGIDPVRALAVPRIVSITIVTTLLAVPAEIITVLTSQLAGSYIGGLNAAEFYSFEWTNLSPVELVAMVINTLLAGLLIGAVCCYKGMTAAGGAIGLGRAVNQAVVISFVALFVMQLGYNAIVLGFFPGLGAFK